jgi:plastocyanin
MFLKSRLVNTSVAMVLMLGTGLGLSSHSAFADQLKQEGAQKFNVQIGAQIFTDEGGKPAWQGMKFYPGTITVNVGDTVTWKANAGAEPHTVTFMGNETSFPELFTPEGGAAPDAGGPPPAGGHPHSKIYNHNLA